MKIHKIRKGNKVRIVYALSDKEKMHNANYKKELQSLCLQHCDSRIVHGFMPFRSAVTNARKHIGFKYTLTNDLADFFDSITVNHVKHLINNPQILKWCFFQGAPRQGFPTSPLIANLATVELDNVIQTELEKTGIEFVYTRYADDLTISFNDRSQLKQIQKIVKMSVRNCNFHLNKKKSRLYNSNGGKFRSVTGISVGDDDIHPPRHIKRKLRAARHQNKTASVAGLEEYMSFNGCGI